MDKEKVVSVFRKIEAITIGAIGVFFIGYGITYFQEQSSYNVPRILYPVFATLGNVGLAIGMLILGGGLIYWGFTKWKSLADNKKLYWIIVAVGILVAIVLAKIAVDIVASNKSSDVTEETDKRELGFKNSEAEEHVANFETLYKRFEQSLQDNDEATQRDCEEEFRNWGFKTSEIFHRLKDTKEQTSFLRYCENLVKQYHNLRDEYY